MPPSPADLVSLARVLVVAVLVFLQKNTKWGGGGVLRYPYLDPGPHPISCG